MSHTLGPSDTLKRPGLRLQPGFLTVFSPDYDTICVVLWLEMTKFRASLWGGGIAKIAISCYFEPVVMKKIFVSKRFED